MWSCLFTKLIVKQREYCGRGQVLCKTTRYLDLQLARSDLLIGGEQRKSLANMRGSLFRTTEYKGQSYIL